MTTFPCKSNNRRWKKKKINKKINKLYILKEKRNCANGFSDILHIYFKFTYTNLVPKCRSFIGRSDALSFVKIIGTKTCVFDVKCRRGQNSIPSMSTSPPNYSNHSRVHWPDVTSNNVIGITFHSWLNVALRSLTLLMTWFSLTLRPRTSQTCSMGFMSREQAGNWSTLTLCLAR